MFVDPTGLWSWAQTWGVVKAIGGAVEMGVGAVALSAGWTGVGAVVGGAAVVHGADTFQAGIRQAISGGEVDTLTSQGMQAVGVSRNVANGIDAGVGIVASGGAGIVKGVQMAGKASKGLEFSHWIPNRYGFKSYTVYNGNYVSKEFHALSDSYRYRFMSAEWKRVNPPTPLLMQQWNRIPYLYKGAAAGSVPQIFLRGSEYIFTTEANTNSSSNCGR
jgi:hypothetical protein